MMITLKRIIKSGLRTFWRNSLLSASSILVITIALVVSLSSFFSIILIQEVIERVEEKVDIHIYFNKEASGEKIIELKNLINILAEVDSEKTEYISKEDVLANFKEKHFEEEDTITALELLGVNPLGAVLNIKAKEIKYYDEINSFLESKNIQEKFGDIIDNISYNKNKKTIETLERLIDYTYLIGGVISIILILISIIITFNTVRLTIYTQKEKIAIMRLVGASKFFARGPFLIEGVLYGFISAVFAFFITWAVVFYTSEALQSLFFLDLNVFFSSNIFAIFGSLALSGIILGFAVTYLAVAKYIKV